MSNMIPAGLYRIANVAYPNRYISMLEDHFVGYNEGEIIQVEIIDNDAGLVALFDTVTASYIGVDLKKNKVVGYPSRQVLQLSVDESQNIVIHPKDVNSRVWVLNNDGDGTPITVEPAPASNKKYWTFERAE
ncbi:hypothetical protein EV424DRAFT_1546371 [Suillus variegatus]|nr:hypothetical protein EV424DRAFT_1547068 [Suillus variegatus]KAG1798036.1 hypothetical protein EV424DRAFT_1546371 [Suillus variegatus]